MKEENKIICPKCHEKVLGYNVGVGENRTHQHWIPDQRWENYEYVK